MKPDTSLRHLRPSVIMPASLSLRGPHFPSATTLATCLLSLLQLLPSLGLCAGHFFSSFLSLSELPYFIFSITLTTTGKYIIYFFIGIVCFFGLFVYLYLSLLPNPSPQCQLCKRLGMFPTAPLAPGTAPDPQRYSVVICWVTE